MILMLPGTDLPTWHFFKSRKSIYPSHKIASRLLKNFGELSNILQLKTKPKHGLTHHHQQQQNNKNLFSATAKEEMSFFFFFGKMSLNDISRRAVKNETSNEKNLPAMFYSFG